MGAAVAGASVAVFAFLTPLIAENISVDPATVMGGGGLTMGGILIHAVWRYLKRSDALQELQQKVAEATLRSLDAETGHREAERSHWRMVENKLLNQEKALERLDSGRFTPVSGIPLEPGVPR